MYADFDSLDLEEFFNIDEQSLGYSKNETFASENERIINCPPIFIDDFDDLCDDLIFDSDSQSDLSPEQSNSVESENDLIALKKRRVSFPLRRMMDIDIRRKYVQMVGNVLNSHDGDIMMKFWSNFCSKDTKMRRIFSSGTPGSKFFPSCSVFKGIPGMVLYWSSVLQTMPDHVIRLPDVKIHVQSDKHGCIITARYVANANLIYDELRPQHLWTSFMESDKNFFDTNCSKVHFPVKKRYSKSKNLLVNAPKNSFDSSASNFPCTEPLSAFISKTGNIPKIRDPPAEISVNGYFRMYLNSRKQIIGIDISS